MNRFLFAAGAIVLMGVAAAQNPAPPAQPAKGGRGAQTGGFGQPGGFPTTRTTAAKMLQMEEEVELLEAQRDTKRAYVEATEVAVRAAEVNLDRLSKTAAVAGVSREEVDRARLEVEAAKAQVKIRMSEMKEIEVKIKFAKRRLDDAKAAPPRPNPFRDPKVDPKPADPTTREVKPG